MNMNFFDCFYNIAALTTCVFNNEGYSLPHGMMSEVKITEELSVTSKYGYFDHDPETGRPVPRPYHRFIILFHRKDKLVDSISYSAVSPNDKGFYVYDLLDRRLDISLKLQILNELKPGIIVKMQNLVHKINLTNEEMQAFIQKSEELVNQAKLLADETKPRSR